MSQLKSSYPNAFCVKCGSHTDTLKKHTVVLTNNSRALKGICGACASEVYKILPKIRAAHATRVPLTAEERQQYPDAYCVKCQTHTATSNAHTVMLENMSRAVTGNCKSCGSEVYRILGGRGEKVAEMPMVKAQSSQSSLVKSVAKAVEKAAGSERRVVMARSAEAAKLSYRWTYVAAAGVIAGIVAAFFVYAVL